MAGNELIQDVLVQMRNYLRKNLRTLEKIDAKLGNKQGTAMLGELEQAPEDINWQQYFLKLDTMLSGEGVTLPDMFRQLMEVGVLNPQTVPPARALPFKTTCRKTKVPVAGETGTGTGTGGTGTGTGTGGTGETGQTGETGEPVPPGGDEGGQGDQL